MIPKTYIFHYNWMNWNGELEAKKEDFFLHLQWTQSFLPTLFCFPVSEQNNGYSGCTLQ